MARTRQDLEPIVRGDGFDGATFNLMDDANPANPIDLTGASARMMVRQNLADRTLAPLLSLTTDANGGLTITDPTNGQIRIDVINGPLDIPAGGYFYDIEITFASGRIQTPIFGQWQIEEEATFTTQTS